VSPIETDRLTLRNFRPDDWRDLHEMIVKYQASEYAKYDHAWPSSEAEIQGVAARFAGGDAYLAVCLRTSGKVIGFVCLNPTENPGELDLGYVFNANFHGKGYATEACRAALDRAFGELVAERIVTGTAAANVPSCRLLDRLGFVKTNEGWGSFQTTPDGKPIGFVGYEFEVTRNAWNVGNRELFMARGIDIEWVADAGETAS
jgi:[ribosomal protein S5]-alanine N-acetyltransferase